MINFSDTAQGNTTVILPSYQDQYTISISLDRLTKLYLKASEKGMTGDNLLRLIDGRELEPDDVGKEVFEGATNDELQCVRLTMWELKIAPLHGEEDEEFQNAKRLMDHFMEVQRINEGRVVDEGGANARERR